MILRPAKRYRIPSASRSTSIRRYHPERHSTLFRQLTELHFQYPNTPSVYPSNTREAQIAFEKNVRQPFAFTVFPLVMMDIYDGVEDKDREYFRRTREALFGGTLESVVPQGEKRKAQLELVRAGLDKVAQEIATHAGEGALFFGGDTPCFADMSLAAAEDAASVLEQFVHDGSHLRPNFT